jgi:DNA-binding NarL/FixJ family response regulator
VGNAAAATAPERIRVVLVDDDPLARHAMRTGLQGAGMVVIADAASAQDALSLASHYRPDVVVMDVLLEGADGIAATRAITARAPEVRVLLVTRSADAGVGLVALRAGASGFVSKDGEISALVGAVRRVAAGEVALAPALSRHLVDVVRALPEGGLGVRPVQSVLTTREWEVLDLLCEGQGVDDIAGNLVLARETVRTHIKRILRKLGVHTRQDAVRQAHGLRAPYGTAPLPSAED